ncbi:MAG TPA: Sec-independent protein translocase subunit TatA [Mycobacteriales bacterium]|nr:Sec-independent protein translocase subunit TatA [Mycobacteriales bacterium]
MPDLGPWEILIIAVVILVLFGAKKMPDAARSLGRSMRIFRTEIKGMHDDEDAAKAAPAQPQQPQQLPPAPPTPAVTSGEQHSTSTTSAGDNPDRR